MTHNQIEYNKWLETRRSNQANERLTELRDARSYEINLGNLEESKRHNRAYEQQLRDDLNERIRSFDLNLQHQKDQLLETQRHNQEVELNALHSLKETERSNLAREAETNRSNLAKEVETNRSNLAREKETNRANLAQEAETKRSHLANESIGRSQVSLGYAQLAETNRANLERERLNRINTSETIRHQKAQEVELNRHNIAQEDIGERANVIATRNANTREYESETGRINAWANVIGKADDVARAASIVVDLFGGSNYGTQTNKEVQEAQRNEDNNYNSPGTGRSRKSGGFSGK